MTSLKEYDLVILGSGEGSKFLAWTLAREGQRVAVVERRYIGGSCPNIACLPSKNIINFKRSGAELVLGSGRFVAPKTIEVSLKDGTTRQLHGKNVIIGTGTRASLENIPGLAEAEPLTHIEALELDQVPRHLLVIGGGYIGLELSQAIRRFGSRVTILDRNERLVHREDEDVADGLRQLFEEEGIELSFGARITKVSGRSGDAIQVTLEQNGELTTLEGTHLLVATGRTPNTDDIGLEQAGVELNDRGYVKVNARLETTAPGVWAIGESAGSPQFTHIAFDDFRVIRDNLVGGDHVTTGRQVPFCMFTDPEFARIGLSESEAREQGLSYRLFKIPMSSVLRTRTLSETRGFMKALVEAESNRILGFTAFGVNAGEMMGSVQIAMLAGLPYTGLRDAILTHPTLLEGLVVLFSSAPSMIPLQPSPVDPTAGVEGTERREPV